jgi:hypothetical protein
VSLAFRDETAQQHLHQPLRAREPDIRETSCNLARHSKSGYGVKDREYPHASYSLLFKIGQSCIKKEPRRVYDRFLFMCALRDNNLSLQAEQRARLSSSHQNKTVILSDRPLSSPKGKGVEEPAFGGARLPSSDDRVRHAFLRLEASPRCAAF